MAAQGAGGLLMLLGALSGDRDLARVGAAWMKAVICADRGLRDESLAECERLTILDPEISSVEDANTWLDLPLEDLEALRES